ncbi:uncharacterized protein LOC116853076 isoform X3 [Odontomachus brunneus]|uniref:uncharacterized protein LOC116853076 isoform X3 n=1 Tax=Odontomachus brunneus TaxID=486640 RepID=UPI0013F28A88|nr:uncharacterized protein LOC116853076 isoform X3 [Odontomachus brunneus]
MKILGIIVRLLAIIMVAHAYNYLRTIKFKDNLIDCNLEMGETNFMLTNIKGEVFFCALKRDGQIFERSADKIIKDEMYNFLMDTIENENVATISWRLFRICYDNADEWNKYPKDKWNYIFNCSAPIIPRLMLERFG